jgi:16S rRNA (guanine966-N2)-methyltransferase
MRVISGRLRGRRIEAPRSRGVRPTYDRVRESVFAIIEPMLDGASVLDLFAGTGALSIEAISRGAAFATLIERDRETARVAARNIETLGLEASCRLRVGDAMRLVASPLPGAPFGVVFIDPPYASGLAGKAMRALTGGPNLSGPPAVVVVERSTDSAAEVESGGLSLVRAERYGSTTVDFYERRS